MFPRREFTKEDYKKKLLDLELAPSASVVLLPVCIYIYIYIIIILSILTVLFVLLVIFSYKSESKVKSVLWVITIQIIQKCWASLLFHYSGLYICFAGEALNKFSSFVLTCFHVPKEKVGRRR